MYYVYKRYSICFYLCFYTGMNMSDIIKLFQDYNYADWQASFLQEVGNEHVDKMLFVIDGIKFQPLMSDEMAIPRGYLPKKNSKILFGEIFDLTYEDVKTIDIIESLNNDFSAPVFKVDDKTEFKLFDGIQLNAINASFYADNISFSKWLEFLSTHQDIESSQLRLYNAELPDNSPARHYLEYYTNEAVIPFIRKLQLLANEIDVYDFQININFSGQFVHDVIKARAIKIAWFNILSSLGKPVKPYHLEVYLPCISSYPDSVISHTLQIVAATMAQADFIVFEHNVESNERRIYRNAGHIAMIESQFGKEVDPVAGSYFIEYVASEIAKKAFVS